MRRILLTLFGILTFTLCSSAQDDRDYVKRVNASIDRGVQFLQQQEGGTGNWERFGIIQMVDQTGGPSALATLALLNSGVKPSEKIIERSLDHLRKIQPAKTYVVALTTMVFAEAKQAATSRRFNVT